MTESTPISDLVFRAPSTSSVQQATTFTPPPMEFLQTEWYVTHSTLPMWKKNRNITITYTALNDPPGALDDLVRYQPIKSDKKKTVRGTDHLDPNVAGKYTWRGRGWLKIASSKWEILGFGEEDGGWAVTYFAKTLFTPAGIDIYARTKKSTSAALLSKIKNEMRKVADDDFRTLADELFEILHE